MTEERIGDARADAEASRVERELAEANARSHRLLRGGIDRAREQAMAARDRAQAAGPRFAPDLWDAAEVKAGEAETILAPGDPLPFDAYSRALRTFDEAAVLYRRAENQARDTVRPLGIEARQAREPAGADTLADTVVPAPPAADMRPAMVRPLIEPSPARRASRRWPRRAGRVALGAVALAAAATAVLYWWPASPPRESAGGFTAARNEETTRSEDPSRARASLARDEAVRAGADKLAPVLFTAALRKAQEGDLALDRRDAAAAQGRYREAVEAFERARDAAIRFGLQSRAEDEAAAVERRPAQARRSPEAAAGRPGPAEGSTPAQPPVRDEGPRDASQIGAMSSTSRAPQNVERARTAMAAARGAAEKVAAGFFSNKRFASAQSKEREGLAALGRSEYAEATRLFAEAQSEYQTSTQEATQEAERERQLAPLRATLEQAHATVAARRQEALAADAERLARDVFDQAQNRQVEGDGLAGRQDLVAAAQAYRDAADRYGEAIRRARAAR